MDDASFRHMSTCGCSYVHTPAFDRVANEGLLFMNTYTPVALSAPSRASMLTGRYPWQLEEASGQFTLFPKHYKTFPEALRENGYITGKTGKGWNPGNPGQIDVKQKDPRIPGNGDVFETYPFSLDFLNNYYEKYMDGTYQKGMVWWINSTDYEDPDFYFGYKAGAGK